MRTIAIMLVLAGTIVSAGCASTAALHPFVTDREGAVDASLTGVWGEENGDGVVVIRLVGATYWITYSDKSSLVRLQARLLKTASAAIFDLSPDYKNEFALPAHLPVRIWLEGDTLRYTVLDSAWLKDLIREELAFEDAGGTLVITAPGDAVARFLAAHGGDERAFSSTVELVRMR